MRQIFAGGNVPSRLVILDFTAIDQLGGHSYEYDRNVVTAFLARGWECVVYAHHACRLKFVGGAEIRPLFTYVTTDTIVRAKLLRPFVKLFVHATRTAKEIRYAILAEDTPDTVFFAQTVEPYHVWALYRALSKPLCGKLVIMLRATSLRTVGGNPRPTFRTALYWFGLRRIRRLGAKVVLVADSELLQEEYQPLTAVPIHLVPHPNPVPLETTKRAHNASLCITAVGRLAVDKGSQYLPQIMAIVHRKSFSARFAIHIHTDSPNASQVYGPLQASIRANARTEDVLFETPLGTEDYWRQLEAADVVLLLYDPSRYHNQISGVLMDALAAGCFPIVSDDTWLARVVRSVGFGAVVRLDSNLSESVAAILKAGIPNAIPEKVRSFVQFHTRDNFLAVLTSILQRNAV